MNPPEIVTIEAGRARARYLRDLYRYRDLLVLLVWRDVLVRYKQTVLGVSWALLRPALTLITFTLVFGRLAHLPDGGAPYSVLVLSALLPFQFFASALHEASGSLIGNASLLSKVFFPRLLIPLSATLGALLDFFVSFGLLFALMLWHGVRPAARLLLLLPLTLLTLLCALGAGIWFAALNVRYRDFRYVVPFLIQLGYYVSPIGWGSGLVPERWRLLYALNPLVGIIDGFRFAVLGQVPFRPGLVLAPCLIALLLLSGVRYFHQAERAFADII